MMAGRLNKRITIEHLAGSEDNFLGEMENSEKKFFTTRSDVVWGNGRRETANMEIVFSYEITFIVWIYFYSKIKEGDFVTYAGKKFRIVSLEPEPETKILYIRAQSE